MTSRKMYHRNRKPTTRLRVPKTRLGARAPEFEANRLTVESCPWHVSEEQREAWALARKRRQWVRRQMRETLPEREALAIEFHYFRRLSLTECGGRLGMHPTTVQRCIERGIRRLRLRARLSTMLWSEESPFTPEFESPAEPVSGQPPYQRTIAEPQVTPAPKLASNR